MRETPHSLEDALAEKSLLRSTGRERGKNWLGTMAVWLSGISVVVYFFTSYAVKNYFQFLIENLQKTLEKIGAF